MNPALILSKTVLVFIWDFFFFAALNLRAQREGAVTLETVVGCCAAAGQRSGRPLLGRWAWKSAGCGVQSHPGSSRLVAGEAVLVEMSGLW